MSSGRKGGLGDLDYDNIFCFALNGTATLKYLRVNICSARDPFVLILDFKRSHYFMPVHIAFSCGRVFMGIL